MEHLPDLDGKNVCDYHQRLTPSSDSFGNEHNKTDDQPILRLIRNCCPGYQATFDRRRCTSTMDFPNLFKDSDNFSLAVICLAVLLLIVSALSSLIAYRYYYRYRIGRKAGILTEEQDMEAHEDNFVVGFTMNQQHLDDNPYKQTLVR
ncbi:hypothetical protein M3Y97_00437500 [Aphelenchoides bicaudatus]|nr:hypothetical protein M3Y97_00437500 [Aphelenchoides bicaudatus]